MYKISKNLDIEFDYSPFFEKVEKLGKSPSKFIIENGFSSNLLHRMRRHMNMSFTTMFIIMKSAGIDDPHDFVNIRIIETKDNKRNK